MCTPAERDCLCKDPKVKRGLVCSMNGKTQESGVVCGEGGGECYKTRLERWAMIETLEFILSVMGAYPSVQACDKLWGLQSTRWSLVSGEGGDRSHVTISTSM